METSLSGVMPILYLVLGITGFILGTGIFVSLWRYLHSVAVLAENEARLSSAGKVFDAFISTVDIGEGRKGQEDLVDAVASWGNDRTTDEDFDLIDVQAYYTQRADELIDAGFGSDRPNTND